MNVCADWASMCPSTALHCTASSMLMNRFVAPAAPPATSRDVSLRTLKRLLATAPALSFQLPSPFCPYPPHPCVLTAVNIMINNK
mmetsp:Transcript_24701/g.41767  ORF Transcript_24701/g.41767 Transcript_24701/m.41767 type:complete len:85 (-) Transcript_24701:2-256(-)